MYLSTYYQGTGSRFSTLLSLSQIDMSRFFTSESLCSFIQQPCKDPPPEEALDGLHGLYHLGGISEREIEEQWKNG